MEVKVNITRADLLKMNYYTLFRIKANYIWFAFFFICALAGACKSITLHGAPIWLTISALVTIVIYFLLFNIGVIMQIVFASAENGSIGPTVYNLSEEFFGETTKGTETKTKWQSINSIHKFKNYMFIQISGYRFHIVPKRDFSDSQKFEQFCTMVNDRMENT